MTDTPLSKEELLQSPGCAPDRAVRAQALAARYLSLLHTLHRHGARHQLYCEPCGGYMDAHNENCPLEAAVKGFNGT